MPDKMAIQFLQTIWISVDQNKTRLHILPFTIPEKDD